MRRGILSGVPSILLIVVALGTASRAQDLHGLAAQLPVSLPVPAPTAPQPNAGGLSEKLNPALRPLIAGAISKGVGGEPPARIPVTLIANTESGVAALEAEIARSGGIVMQTFGNTILARIPAPAIVRLASLEDVYYAAPQPEVYPLQDLSHSAGDGISGAGTNALRAQGFTGKQAKVGVLDFGFRNYTKLVQAGRLPQAKAIKTFGASNDFEAGTGHGTACAEIVHTMAPGADLYLAAMGGGTSSMDQFASAAQWLADQGVRIISFSGGTHEAPHNGNGLMDAIVDRIVKRYNILWVNAAGNEGETHWSGLTADRNADGWVDIAGASPYLLLRPHTDSLSILITWDDWGPNPQLPQSFQDVDAFLFRYSDAFAGRPKPVAQSINPQNGRAFPIEKIGPLKVNPGDTFVLGLQAKHLTRAVRIHVYCLTSAEIEPRSPDGSVIAPATSSAAVAVGAVNVNNDELEPFSSRGPTDDGRIKPDLTAPDNVPSDSASGGRFGGTSAASPYVAGFAALLQQKHPGLGVDGLRNLLLSAVRARGSPQPNNSFGFGEIEAGEAKQRYDPGDSLLDLLSAQAGKLRDGQLRLGLNLPPGAYPIGYRTLLVATSSAPCFCQLYHRDGNGHYSLEFSTEAALQTGQHDLGTLSIVEPPGQEELLLIGSRAPIAWERIGPGHIPPLTVIAVHYQVTSSAGKKN